jgi:hypothetical protein
MTNLQLIINALNEKRYNAIAMNNIDLGVESLKEELSTFLNYEVAVKRKASSLVVNVSCFSLSFTASEKDTLNLKITVNNPFYVGLNYERQFSVQNFNLDWHLMYDLFKTEMEKWHIFELSELKSVDEHFVRPNNGIIVKVTRFSGGAFGTGIQDAKTQSIGRTSFLEAKLLADKYGEKLQTDFVIVSQGQRPDTPFWEYQLDYSLTPKVTEVIINNETHYSFKERGKAYTHKVMETTNFGEDIRVDTTYCLENELTFKSGVASYANDVISAYINRKNKNIG